MTTDSDQRTETWKAVPGFSGYEASDNSVWRLEARDVGDAFEGHLVQVSGGIRSIDRTVGGRRFKGVLLTGRLNSSGYVLVNMVDDEGAKRTMLAHLVILLTHVGPRPEGMETLHNPERGALWCRVPEDMRYGTRPENVADWKKSNPARPKPQKLCVRCNEPFTGNGRRCHPCVVDIGVEAGRLLRAGAPLGEVAEHLGYPSAEGVHTLAVKYGGYGVERPSWTQRVAATLRHLLPGGDAK